MPEPISAELEPPETLAEALAALQAQLPKVAKTAGAQYGSQREARNA